MSRVELDIKKLLQSISIYEPQQLNAKEISFRLGIRIKYWEFTSEAVKYRNRKYIFLNDNLSLQKQWYDFSHELFHLFYHVGRQESLKKSFVYLQEKQANYFAYHFCVPTFMLEKLEEVSIDVIMNLFNVDYDFALRRFEMYQSKIIERMLVYEGSCR